LGLGVFLLLVVVTCGCRSHGKPVPRPASSPDGGQAAAARPSPTTAPPGVPLPEFSGRPGKDARRGGVLKVHLEAEPPHLNPLQDTLQAIERVTSGLVYETLIECRGGDYRAGLADTWELSPDGLRIQLHLRAGPRWHDDKALTAIDVQASLEHLMRSPARSALLHTMIADLEGVDVLPERGVRLRLTRPSGLTLRALCEIPILPAEALRAGGPRLTQLGRAPVGTGPFRFSAWERGKRIKLVRARPLDAPDGPWLDEIDFEIDSDPARALTRLRRGDVDVLPRLAEVHYPEQVSQATLRDVLTLHTLAPHRYTFVVVNTRRGVLADQAMRHALSLLWDRARFAAEFHHGLVRPIGAPTFGPAAPDRFDRELAGRRLEEAGFRDSDGDGVRDVGRSPIRLTFLVPSGARTLASEVRAYAMDLRRSGILLDTSTLDAASLFARIESGDYDLAALTWEGRADEDPRLLFSSTGEFEYTGYRSERLSALVDAIRVAPSPSARAPLLGQLAGQLAVDRPALFLYRHDVVLLASRRVHGLAAVGDHLDLRSVWVDP
jgi:peptide/nickel transport system substrate-binding protein